MSENSGDLYGREDTHGEDTLAHNISGEIPAKNEEQLE